MSKFTTQLNETPTVFSLVEGPENITLRMTKEGVGMNSVLNINKTTGQFTRVSCISSAFGVPLQPGTTLVDIK